MPTTTHHLTVYEQEIDTSTGLFTDALSLPFSSGTFSVSFSELPCKCAPTMVCIPIIATLELRWTGFMGTPLNVKNGNLSFERKGPSKRDVVSVGIRGIFPAETDGVIKANSFVAYGREKMITIRLELEVDIEMERTSLARSLDLLQGRTTLDVCLVFPQEHNLRLFANSKVLSDASPYWKAQLSSQGFSELLSSLDLTETELEECEQDSDFEADVNEVEPANKPDTFPLPSHIRAIPIYGTSYATYRALLLFLYTSQIAFSPLSSSFSSQSERWRAHSLSTAFNPSSPPPCSPKSLYCLSHFLSISEISDIALEAYVAKLTLDNALTELLSGFCETYEAARTRVLEWLLESDQGRWIHVSQSKAARDWRDRVRKEGISEVELEILFKLGGIN